MWTPGVEGREGSCKHRNTHFPSGMAFHMSQTSLSGITGKMPKERRHLLRVPSAALTPGDQPATWQELCLCLAHSALSHPRH